MLHILRKPKDSKPVSLPEEAGSENNTTEVLFLRATMLFSELPKEQCYRYVGECYVHGLMDGEVLNIMKSTGMHFFHVAIK
jgi:hypothetical protein